MKFTSLTQLKNYVEKAQKQSMEVLNQNLETEAKKITLSELGRSSSKTKTGNIYEPTGAIIDCIKGQVNGLSLTLVWGDTGDWFSILDKSHGHFYAPEALEEGTVWAEGTKLHPYSPVFKPATDFVDKTEEWRNNELPNVFVQFMRGKGMNIKRV